MSQQLKEYETSRPNVDLARVELFSEPALWGSVKRRSHVLGVLPTGLLDMFLPLVACHTEVNYL